MAEDELQIVVLRDDFYRGGFGKVIIIIFGLLLAIASLVALSFYLHITKPQPLTFPVDQEWRVQSDVPLTDPYVTQDVVFQWLNDTFNKVFILDFIHYNDQLQSYQRYFTDNGWNVFLNHLNNYANYNTVQTNRLFVTSVPIGVPSPLNQGILTGRYFWLIELPVTVKYDGMSPSSPVNLKLQVRIVRVSTLTNLAGIGIDDMLVLNMTQPTTAPSNIMNRTGSIR